jgi:hypothetical protein
LVSDIIGFLLLIVLVMVSVALLPINRIGKSWVFAISCGLLFAPVVIVGHGVGIAPFFSVLITSPVFLLGWLSAVSFLVTTGLAFAIGWVAFPAIPITLKGIRRHIDQHIGSGNMSAKIAQGWFSLNFLLVVILLFVQGAATAATTYVWIMIYLTAPVGFIYYILLAISGLLPSEHLGEISGAIPYAHGYANVVRYALVFIGLPFVGYLQWFVLAPFLLRKVRGYFS